MSACRVYVIHVRANTNFGTKLGEGLEGRSGNEWMAITSPNRCHLPWNATSQYPVPSSSWCMKWTRRKRDKNTMLYSLCMTAGTLSDIRCVAVIAYLERVWSVSHTFKHRKHDAIIFILPDRFACQTSNSELSCGRLRDICAAALLIVVTLLCVPASLLRLPPARTLC